MVQKGAKNKNSVVHLDQKNDHSDKETNPLFFLKKEYDLTGRKYQSNTHMHKE